MKKSIFLLLFLFLVLLVTCVYQKTYTLYENTHATDKNTLQNVKIKRVTTSTKKEPVVNKEEKSATKELGLVEKIKTSVISAINSEKEDVPNSVNIVKESRPLVVIPKKNALNTKIEEKEVVDYLLTVLKEQNIALAHRDEAESKLHALITQVLKERHIAIENMEKASLDIDTRHQKQIKERDVKSQNIYKINTEEGK